MMKIFITGGTSYLGRHMVPYMNARGHDLCHTWYSTPPIDNFPGYAVQVDIRDTDRFTEIAMDFQPDVLVHLAASNRSENEEAMVASIEQGALGVTKIAQALDCRLIYMSTDVVFDGKQNLYYEDTPVSPLHAYGRAKANAEQMVAAYLNSVIIRPSLIFSLQTKDHGTQWIEASLKLGKDIVLFTDQIRQPVWVDTLSEACLELIHHDYCGIVHIVGRQSLSRAEFGRKMLDWWGISNRETLKFGPMPSYSAWPECLRLDTSLATSILKTPLLGVDEVIKRSTLCQSDPG
ncbi:MAG: dTDP-4-dehydrorhamnose reductase [Cellvibrionaceae bacterium]|jgi:dTDP-4-dehydrorhamnose reductase